MTSLCGFSDYSVNFFILLIEITYGSENFFQLQLVVSTSFFKQKIETSISLYLCISCLIILQSLPELLHFQVLSC